MKLVQVLAYLVLSTFQPCLAFLQARVGVWLAYQPPPNPRIYTEIYQFPYGFGEKSHPTDVIATTTLDATLTIRAGSTIVLICLAQYHVLWWKNGEKVFYKKRNYNASDYLKSVPYYLGQKKIHNVEKPWEFYDWKESKYFDVNDSYSLPATVFDLAAF